MLQTSIRSLSPLFLGILFTVGIIFPSSAENTSQPKKRPLRFAFVDFKPPSEVNGQPVCNNLVLNLLYSYSGSLKGFELGGLVNQLKGDMKGVQIAGLSNISSGSMSGLQIAGLTNVVSESKNKVAPISPKTITGFQLAGLANINLQSNANGNQIAGITNVSTGNFEGFQIGGLANVVLPNSQSENKEEPLLVQGLQLAGLTNIAPNAKVSGIQLSGLANVAQQVQGVQIGLVNVAPQGAFGAIGLVNISKDGYRSLSFNFEDSTHSSFNYRSGGRYLYSILSLGGSFFKPIKKWTYGGGIGAFLTRKKNLALEGTIRHVSFDPPFTFKSKNDDKLNLFVQLRFLYRLNFSHLQLLMGPTLNFTWTNPKLKVKRKKKIKRKRGDTTISSFRSLTHFGMRTNSKQYLHKMWPGLFLGVGINL